MIDENLSKNLHLINELNASVKLLELGLGEIQNLSLENDFYFLPLQLLSSGLERLMKSYICLGFYEINNDYPDSSYLKKCGGKSGHDLIELKKAIAENYFKTNGIFILEEDLNIISNDKKLDELIYLLSEFGKYSRYYNLDVVTSASKPSIDVVTLWEEFENNILHSKPELFETLSNIETSQKAFDYINRAIIIHLERFIRALCRQFTLGALGKKALEFSIIVSSFSKLVDEKIGDRNYRGNTNN